MECKRREVSKCTRPLVMTYGNGRKSRVKSTGRNQSVAVGSCALRPRHRHRPGRRVRSFVGIGAERLPIACIYSEVTGIGTEANGWPGGQRSSRFTRSDSSSPFKHCSALRLAPTAFTQLAAS